MGILICIIGGVIGLFSMMAIGGLIDRCGHWLLEHLVPNPHQP